jgi:hypothetical protein
VRDITSCYRRFCPGLKIHRYGITAFPGVAQARTCREGFSGSQLSRAPVPSLLQASHLSSEYYRRLIGIGHTPAVTTSRSGVHTSWRQSFSPSFFVVHFAAMPLGSIVVREPTAILLSFLFRSPCRCNALRIHRRPGLPCELLERHVCLSQNRRHIMAGI